MGVISPDYTKDALRHDSTKTLHHPHRCDYGSKLPSLAASPIKGEANGASSPIKAASYSIPVSVGSPSATRPTSSYTLLAVAMCCVATCASRKRRWSELVI